MTELEQAIGRRNARLRAWKAHGVPVEGGWVLVQRPPERWYDIRQGKTVDHRFEPSLLLRFSCLVCPDVRTYEMEADEQLERAEFRAVRCPHLLPLLSPDPEEVRATTELEMLAG